MSYPNAFVILCNLVTIGFLVLTVYNLRRAERASRELHELLERQRIEQLERSPVQRAGASADQARNSKASMPCMYTI